MFEESNVGVHTMFQYEKVYYRSFHTSTAFSASEVMPDAQRNLLLPSSREIVGIDSTITWCAFSEYILCYE